MMRRKTGLRGLVPVSLRRESMAVCDTYMVRGRGDTEVDSGHVLAHLPLGVIQLHFRRRGCQAGTEDPRLEYQALSEWYAITHHVQSALS